jgi:hypothetical protein
MSNTLSITQGSGSITVSTNGSDLTTPNSSNQVFLNENSGTKITITFQDGTSIYLTNFSESTFGSSVNANVLGATSSADAGFSGTVNLIAGFGYLATFDVYDASTNTLIAHVKPNTNYPNSPSPFAPAVTLEESGGTITIENYVGSTVTGYSEYQDSVTNSGALSLQDAGAPYHAQVYGTITPVASSSSLNFYVGGYNASALDLNGASTYTSTGTFSNTYDTSASVHLDSSLVGTVGSLNNLITVDNLVGLNSQNAINSTTFTTNDVLPLQNLDATLIASIMVEQGVATNQVNYLFATDFTGNGKLAVTSTANANFEDVLVANSPANAGGVTLDLTAYHGIAITGAGVNVTGITSANEVIGAGSATYTMGAGNESIVLNGYNAQVIGGGGVDTVVLQGTTLASVSINAVNANQVQVWSDSVSASSGVNTLTGVDRIQCTDGTIALDTAANQSAGEAYLLYGVFNRTPDQAGLGYWISQLDNGVSAQTVAENFISSSEFQATLGSNLSSTAFISDLYQNVLHRSADAAGLAYWNAQLQGADTLANRATMLESFAFSAEHLALVGSQMAHGVTYQAYAG